MRPVSECRRHEVPAEGDTLIWLEARKPCVVVRVVGPDRYESAEIGSAVVRGAKRRHDIARLPGKGMAQRRAGLLSRDAGVGRQNGI